MYHQIFEGYIFNVDWQTEIFHRNKFRREGLMTATLIHVAMPASVARFSDDVHVAICSHVKFVYLLCIGILCELSFHL